MKRFLRMLLFTVLSILLLAGVAAYFLRKHLQEIILHRLRAEMETTFGHYYHFDFETIHTSLDNWNFGIQMIRPVFTTDTTQTAYLNQYPVLYFKADSIEVGNIDIQRLFSSKTLKLESIVLNNPEVTYLYAKEKRDIQTTTSSTQQRKIIDEIFFRKFHIEKGNISILHLSDPSDTLYYGEKINLLVTNTRIPTYAEEGIYTASKIENILFSMSNVRFEPDRSPYAFLMKELSFNANENTLRCRRVSVVPEKSLFKLSKSARFQKTYAEVRIGNMLLRGIDYDKIGEPALDVNYVEIADSRFNVLRNRNKLLNKNLDKKSLQERLQEISLPLTIDTVRLRNINLSVDILFPKNPEPATIEFKRLDATLRHVTNNQRSRYPMTLHVNGTIMETGKLVFDATFPLYKQTHAYRAHIQNMPFTEWNQFISRIANVELTSGNIKQIHLDGRANSIETSGNIVFEYSDLNATVYRKNKWGKQKKSRVLTYVTNKLLRTNNPRRENTTPDVEEYYFKREPWQGQIMLWIGGLLDGIEATLINSKIKQQIDKAEAKKLRERIK